MSRFLPLILSGRILGHPFSLHLPGRVAAEAAIRPCKEPACLLIGAKPPFEPGHGDLSRRAATGFTVGGEGWYRKRFRNEGLPSGAQVQVLFDGVYMESDVWLNGRHLGRRVRGYAPFSYDLTPALRPGDNLLAVRVRNLGKNSRWCSGSGIYRSVTLDVLPGASHVDRWGVAVSTRRITSDQAEIDVETRLVQAHPDLVVITRLCDAHDKLVAFSSAPAAETVQQTLTLPSPQLWSPDSPYPYTIQTELRRGEALLDKLVTPFGVRIVTLDAETGMQINGSPVKLRGGCVHHDDGLLGAAAHADAENSFRCRQGARLHLL